MSSGNAENVVTMVKAAVLVPIFVSPKQPAAAHNSLRIPGFDVTVPIAETTKVLFTVRSQHVEHHKGQISFPGGIHEADDESLLHTALRETEEEVGIPSSQIEVVGSLPEAITLTSKFEIHPFVGIVRHEKPNLKMSSLEIEKPLFVSLSHLLDQKYQKMETIEHAGQKFKIKSYFLNEHRIWGATARILSTLLSRS